MQKVDVALASFSKYVKSLVRSVPGSVFKMEKQLQDGFEGNSLSTATDDSVLKTNEDTDMKEAAPGDLDGLMEQPHLEDSVEKTDETPVETTAEATAETTDEVEKAEATAESPETTESTDEVVKSESEDTPAETPAEEDPLKMIAAGMKTMADAILAVKSSVEEQGKRIDEIEKTSDTALEKAENTVVMTLNNIDESLSGLSRQRGDVKKSGTGETDDVWSGAIPMFDQL